MTAAGWAVFGIALVGGLAGALAAVLRRMLVLVTVRGFSMAPTLRDGERVLVVRRSSCRRGDIVVFAAPGSGDAGSSAGTTGDVLGDAVGDTMGDVDWLVKRVAAVAGDPVPSEVRPAVQGDVVPEKHLVVRGDNSRSLDSRRLGYVRSDSVLGVVVRSE